MTSPNLAIPVPLAVLTMWRILLGYGHPRFSAETYYCRTFFGYMLLPEALGLVLSNWWWGVGVWGGVTTCAPSQDQPAYPQHVN